MLTTDFVTLIKDEDCVRGLKILKDGTDVLIKAGVAPEVAQSLKNLFGVSGLCNILGAIKMAKFLRLGPEDNVVTIATDGFDRYNSVLDELAHRTLEMEDFVLERWLKDIFLDADDKHVYDFRRMDLKEQLFQQKEKDWLPFGYSLEYLNSMRTMEFWDGEYEKYREYDEKIKQMR
nr:hypothetical protein [Desulforamulus aquiferis]